MKRALFLLTCLISVFIIHGLIQSIANLWEKREVLSAAEKELSKLKKENKELKNQQKIIQNPNFLEEQARNQLFLLKEGEQIVLLPTGAQKKESVPKNKPKAAFLQWIEFFLKGR